MIAFDNVTKTYGRRARRHRIFDRLSFSLPSRTRLGLLGRNGAGKSTLLRLISGSTAPDRGSIYRSGPVSWPLGFGGALHPALTGRQNAHFVARIYGLDSDDLAALAEEFGELRDFFGQPVATYSQGMRARLAFGISLAVRFDTYLVDEITAVGDAAFRRKCLSAFRKTLENAGLIMVSHDLKTIRDYCDCGAVIESGQVKFFDEIEDAISHYTMLVEAA